MEKLKVLLGKIRQSKTNLLNYFIMEINFLLIDQPAPCMLRRLW